jgi:hypothetical protein
MDRTYYDYPDNNMINDQNNDSLQYTDEIFKAFVDAIIPRTPGLAEEFGKIQYFGALDLYTDEYLILSLNNYYIPIAKPTAEMLEIAAEQLISTEGAELMEFSIYGALAPMDRLRVIASLEHFVVNIADLPIPFQNNPGYILYITSALNRYTMMGYYSEWSGYGTTRLKTPNQRKLEYFPLSWEQVGYPGPSQGYRALRVNNSR